MAQRSKVRQFLEDYHVDESALVPRSLATQSLWEPLVREGGRGILVASRFYENVKKHDFERRKLRSGEKAVSLQLEFSPADSEKMLFPCLVDTLPDGRFHAVALITDEPNPEVAEKGHDRTPVALTRAGAMLIT